MNKDQLNEFENEPSDFFEWSKKEVRIYTMGVGIGLVNGILWTLLVLKLIH